MKQRRHDTSTSDTRKTDQVTCSTEPRKSCSGPGASIAFTSSRSKTPRRASSRSAALPWSWLAAAAPPPFHPLEPTPRLPRQLLLPLPRIPSHSFCCFCTSASCAALCCSGARTVKFMRYRLWNDLGRADSGGSVGFEVVAASGVVVVVVDDEDANTGGALGASSRYAWLFAFLGRASAAAGAALREAAALAFSRRTRNFGTNSVSFWKMTECVRSVGKTTSVCKGRGGVVDQAVHSSTHANEQRFRNNHLHSSAYT